MEKDTLNTLFETLKGSFDTENPPSGHEKRFLDKLKQSQNVADVKRSTKWKAWAIAASILLLCTLSIGLFNEKPSINERVAEISPEASRTEFYFASLIEEQVKQLKSESTPETQKIITDALVQLKKMEMNYTELEKDLLNGGNSKLILSAMITNFQTRIDLLQDVLDQVETIKNYNEEMSQTAL
ncbi:MAG: DUF3379 domain-containing protein [Maribacter sp.]|nr:DUF3379 domain-containing protein [Maribacter sp.]